MARTTKNAGKSLRKMEAEIVRMGINLFHGGEDACGTVRGEKKDCC